MLQYAPLGLLGVLTPQANTTVEPEFSILTPPGVGLLTGRLTSNKPDINDRLADYVLSMERKLDQFANAPLDGVAFACTGAAYLVDPEHENRELARIEGEKGYPLITAANSIADALSVLGAKRIGIISPYGNELHERAMRYWTKRGFDIAQVARVTSADAEFHPIYALASSASREGLGELDAAKLDAVAILGTGLPTLTTILQVAADPLPVISPNICLMWRALLAIKCEPPTVENLKPWITGAAWEDRFAARTVDSSLR